MPKAKRVRIEIFKRSDFKFASSEIVVVVEVEDLGKCFEDNLYEDSSLPKTCCFNCSSFFCSRETDAMYVFEPSTHATSLSSSVLRRLIAFDNFYPIPVY